jgi:hypothetical protein
MSVKYHFRGLNQIYFAESYACFGTTHSNVSRCVLAVDVNSLYPFLTSIKTKFVIGHGKDRSRFI